MHFVFPTRLEPLREQKPSLDFLCTPSVHYRLFKSIFEVIDLKCQTCSWNWDSGLLISTSLALPLLQPVGLS